MVRGNRPWLLIAAAILFVGSSAVPSANAGWFKKALSRAKKIANTAKSKVSSAAKSAKNAVGTAASKVGTAAKNVGKAISNAAKGAFDAAKMFGEKTWNGLKSAAAKAWKISTNAVKAAANKVKELAKKLGNLILAGLIKKAKALAEKHRSVVEPFRTAFKKILADSKMKAVVKRALEKIAKKKIDAGLTKDMKLIGQKLGINTKTACLDRRGEQAPCGSCGIGAFSLGVGAGIAAIAGVSISANVAFGKGGTKAFWAWDWSLGIQAAVGGDLILGLMPDTDVYGKGVGFSLSGKLIGGLGFGMEWGGGNITNMGKGCPSYSIAGGVGVGGGVNILWSEGKKF